jgi:hypothetical protein
MHHYPLIIVLSWVFNADDQFWGIGVSVVSAGTSCLTAYVHPDPQVRIFSLLAGFSSLLIGPITFLQVAYQLLTLSCYH